MHLVSDRTVYTHWIQDNYISAPLSYQTNQRVLDPWTNPTLPVVFHAILAHVSCRVLYLGHHVPNLVRSVHGASQSLQCPCEFHQILFQRCIWPLVWYKWHIKCNAKCGEHIVMINVLKPYIICSYHYLYEIQHVYLHHQHDQCRSCQSNLPHLDQDVVPHLSRLLHPPRRRWPGLTQWDMMSTVGWCRGHVCGCNVGVGRSSCAMISCFSIELKRNGKMYCAWSVRKKRAVSFVWFAKGADEVSNRRDSQK